MTKMPALFIGHGSPMNTLEDNRYTRLWRELGKALPKPRAILAISAHWYIGETALTTMAYPRTIHDFRGFPPQLFAFQYPAVGLPSLFDTVVQAASTYPITADESAWGLDHGTWSVLAHIYPEADIPVVQLSLDATKPAPYHFDLGRKLSVLREEGVLILSSGNVVHHLGMMDGSKPEGGADWAQRFDEAVAHHMAHNPEGVLQMEQHPDYARAVPTPDHYLPLLYVAGVAAEAGESSQLWQGYNYASLSMTSYGVGMDGAAFNHTG